MTSGLFIEVSGRVLHFAAQRCATGSDTEAKGDRRIQPTR